VFEVELLSIQAKNASAAPAGDKPAEEEKK